MMKGMRILLGLSFLALLMVSSPYGCGTPGGGTDGGGDKGKCQKDADCAKNEVCDTAIGKCFPSCEKDADCDTGNKCDTAKKRCVCNPDTCKEPDIANGGCNPVTNFCDTKCKDDTECDTGEKCIGQDGNKFCQKPEDVKDECTKNEDCPDDKPVCDTASTPKKCIAKQGECKVDEDCPDDKPFCEDMSKTCVQCLQDEDCDKGYTCDVTNTCQKSGPVACKDTATCYQSNPKSYCPQDKNKGCQEAPVTCQADMPAKGDNKAWENNIKDGKGSIIWGVEAKRVTAEACSTVIKDDSGNPISCKSNDDCKDVGGFCGKYDKKCRKKNPNQTVEISFYFYHPKGKFKTGFKDTVVHNAGDVPAEKLQILEGDKTSGKAMFSLCFKGSKGKVAQFFVKDEDGYPSNALCYTVP